MVLDVDVTRSFKETGPGSRLYPDFRRPFRWDPWKAFFRSRQVAAATSGVGWTYGTQHVREFGRHRSITCGPFRGRAGAPDLARLGHDPKVIEKGALFSSWVWGATIFRTVPPWAISSSSSFHVPLAGLPSLSLSTRMDSRLPSTLTRR